MVRGLQHSSRGTWFCPTLHTHKTPAIRYNVSVTGAQRSAQLDDSSRFAPAIESAAGSQMGKRFANDILQLVQQNAGPGAPRAGAVVCSLKSLVASHSLLQYQSLARQGLCLLKDLRSL